MPVLLKWGEVTHPTAGEQREPEIGFLGAGLRRGHHKGHASPPPGGSLGA